MVSCSSNHLSKQGCKWGVGLISLRTCLFALDGLYLAMTGSSTYGNEQLQSLRSQHRSLELGWQQWGDSISPLQAKAVTQNSCQCSDAFRLREHLCGGCEERDRGPSQRPRLTTNHYECRPNLLLAQTPSTRNHFFI